MGAAIAAGSQLENGICALFVKAAVMIRKGVHQVISFPQVFSASQCPCEIISAIVIKSITSPTRLVSAVIIPAPRLLGLL